ncbi:MAG TPA: hypothetical protein VM120_28475 [Bryobacteraceae bacterium]|nr:hypothetical protein [Bryobacteraceae bacterium]
MDTRDYYHKIRETVRSLEDEFYVVMSRETPDGGRAGVMTEVNRQQAAKLLVENRARLATAEEAKRHHADNHKNRQEAQALAEASQFQLFKMANAVIRAAEPVLKADLKKSKE